MTNIEKEAMKYYKEIQATVTQTQKSAVIEKRGLSLKSELEDNTIYQMEEQFSHRVMYC